jgi:hypothetical protein
MSNSDPRIAPLAAALRTILSDFDREPDDEYMAVAVPMFLSLLPPDWCGHEAELADAQRRDAMTDHTPPIPPCGHSNRTHPSGCWWPALFDSPDWCGHAQIAATTSANLHDEIRNRDAEIARLRMDLGAVHAFVVAGQARENECERELAMLLAVNHAHAAEIARLRAIEEAARNPRLWYALIAVEEQGMKPEIDALRAAIEEARKVTDG